MWLNNFAAISVKKCLYAFKCSDSPGSPGEAVALMKSRQDKSTRRAHIPARSVNTRWVTEHIADMKTNLTAISVKGFWLNKIAPMTGESCARDFNARLVPDPINRGRSQTARSFQIIKTTDCGVRDSNVDGFRRFGRNLFMEAADYF
jgi:hypothetical protein